MGRTFTATAQRLWDVLRSDIEIAEIAGTTERNSFERSRDQLTREIHRALARDARLLSSVADVLEAAASDPGESIDEHVLHDRLRAGRLAIHRAAWWEDTAESFVEGKGPAETLQWARARGALNQTMTTVNVGEERALWQPDVRPFQYGNPPPVPSCFVGRRDELERLGGGPIAPKASRQSPGSRAWASRRWRLGTLPMRATRSWRGWTRASASQPNS